MGHTTLLTTFISSSVLHSIWPTQCETGSLTYKFLLALLPKPTVSCSYSQSDCIPLYHNISSIIIVVYMNDDSIHCTIVTVMSTWRMCVISCAYTQSRHNHSGHSVRDYHEHNIATWTCQSQIKGVNIDHQFNSANKKRL